MSLIVFRTAKKSSQSGKKWEKGEKTKKNHMDRNKHIHISQTGQDS